MSSIAAMAMSIKNNKRARSAFNKLDKNGSYSTKTKLFFHINASKKQLRDIKEKLIRKTTAILILLIIVIYCIGFAKF